MSGKLGYTAEVQKNVFSTQLVLTQYIEALESSTWTEKGSFHSLALFEENVFALGTSEELQKALHTLTEFSLRLPSPIELLDQDDKEKRIKVRKLCTTFFLRETFLKLKYTSEGP